MSIPPSLSTNFSLISFANDVLVRSKVICKFSMTAARCKKMRADHEERLMHCAR
jgi:hypothetical protein